MKVRQILIILLSFFLLGLIILSFNIGRKGGVKYGVENAEKIRAENQKKIDTTNTNSEKSKYVSVVTVENQLFPITLNGYGKVIASSSINISSEVQGILTSNIVLKKGTHFKKGQILFSIKNTDAKLALKSKKSSFLTLLTSILPDLTIDYPTSYNNWKIFYDKIDVDKPLPQLPEFKNSKEKSFIISRNILSQYYSIKSDEERLNKYTVVAPFSGSIIQAFSDNGAIVSPGMAVIKVLRDGKLEIEIPVLSKNLPLLKKNQKIELRANKNQIIEGTISRIGDYINSETQTVPVFVKINDSKIALYNGMYLESTIRCESNEMAMIIPRTAIFSDEKVYVVDKDNKLIETKIEISTYQDKTVLVTNLKNGTKVVSEAVINVKEGSEVVILNK